MTRPARALVTSVCAASRLDAAAHWLDDRPAPARVLIVATDMAAADALVRRGVGNRGGARFGCERVALGQLVRQLAAVPLARAGQVGASPLAFQAIVARVLHRLGADRALGRLAALEGYPGLVRAVARTVTELRNAGVDGPGMARLSAQDRGLGAILAAVDAALAECGLADLPRATATAAATLRSGGGSAFAGVPLLLLDVAIDQPATADLLACLIGRAPAVLATAIDGDRVAVEHLEALLKCPASRLPDARDTSLARLQGHLFAETAPTPRPLDASVQLQGWPGEARECVEIARLLAAEAAAGTSFEQMAVLLHAPERYGHHLAEALARAQIPAHFVGGTARPHPAGRALLALLACAAEGLSARRFAEYLSLGEVPAGDGSGSPPWRWEHLLVESAVIGGRERWQRRLAGFEAELRRRRAVVADDEAAAAGIERMIGDVEVLAATALPLIDRLAGLPAAAPWGRWLEELRALAGAALRDPTTVLAVLDELTPMSPVGPVDLDEVRLVLGPRLRDSREADAAPAAGAVLVAPTGLARGLVFDVVCIPGLAEKTFPCKVTEDPLLPDEVRARITPQLPRQAERAQAERLALRIAVGAARRRVVLSWPRVDVEQGRARVPSFYALEVLRAATGELPALANIGAASSAVRLGWPAPPRAEEALDDLEYDLAVLAPLLGADDRAASGSAAYLLSANVHLARALRARARRWSRTWTYADGLVVPGTLGQAALARHQLAARSFSATALQHMAACPYRFFLHAIHRLEPRAEAVALEIVDPLTRGALVHDAQFEVLTALAARGLLPVTAETLADALGVLDAAVATVAVRMHDDLAPAIERIWDDAVVMIRADLREWLRRMALVPEWTPHRFELSFGIVDRMRSAADPASVPDSVPVAGALRLRGAIDLVERNAAGRLRVVDHKTGKVRAPQRFVLGHGEVLQPVLYGLAAERLLGAPVESGGLYYCTADGGFVERTVALDDAARAAATEFARIVDGALRAGFFPAAPKPGACTWCDYRAVCGPYEEARVERKPRDPLAELDRLRSMP